MRRGADPAYTARMRRYLDHAASSPLLPAARAAMLGAWERGGNPSSAHASGRAARALLEDARERLADALGAHPTEVVFTSGGTEADNIAVLGASALQAAAERPVVAVSAVEHPAVLDAALSLGADRVRLLDVDHDGRVTAEALDALGEGASGRVSGGVGVVSVMWANNEIGVLQPIDSVVEAARRMGAFAHSDAVAALGHVPLDFAGSGLDALSLSAHKVGGPVGVGALVVRRDAPVAPIGFGGGQERRLRSGTVPVALAAGFAVAASAAVARVAEGRPYGAGLRERLLSGLCEVPGVRVNGGTDVSPGAGHVTVSGCRADDLLLLLDAAGIDCSTGSACTAGVHQPSHVLLAMGRPDADAVGSLRFSFGWSSTAADVDAVLAAFPDAVARARAAAR